MGNTTLILSGQLEDGNITAPVETEMFYIETKSGELEIKLSFSNNKDVDLHLYTPSGQHIFYGNRGGEYVEEEVENPEEYEGYSDEEVEYPAEGSEKIAFGLDIDSNAGCNIDSINKENIYIPAELVEDGEYRVVVDMYANCDPSIPTSWSIVARYQGEIITPTTGTNPASGVYPINAGNDDMTTVMTFTINKTRSVGQKFLNGYSFKPIPLTEMDKMKLEELQFMKSLQ